MKKKVKKTKKEVMMKTSSLFVNQEPNRVVNMTLTTPQKKYDNLKIKILKKISESRDSLLLIFDYRGSVDLVEDLKFYYFLRDLVKKNKDVDIYGLAHGNCTIAEVLILQALKKGRRLSSFDTSFYPIDFECKFCFSTNSDEEETASRFREFYSEKKRINEKVQEIITHRVNGSSKNKSLKSPVKINWGPFKLSSWEALQMGIVDEVYPFGNKVPLI